MRAVAMFSLPDGPDGPPTDAELWERMRKLRLERPRQHAFFAAASDRGATADDVRSHLVSGSKQLLGLVPHKERAEVASELVYHSVLLGTQHSTARDVRFFVTRPGPSDIRAYVFADELGVVLDAADRLVALLRARVGNESSFPLASDITVLEDGQTRSMIVGEPVGDGWLSRVAWACKQSSMSVPVATTALVIGTTLLATAPVLHIPPGLGTSLIGAFIIFALSLLSAARKADRIEWRLVYAPARKGRPGTHRSDPPPRNRPPRRKPPHAPDAKRLRPRRRPAAPSGGA